MPKHLDLSIFQSVITVPIKLEAFLQLSDLLIKSCIRITKSIPGILKRTKDISTFLMANTEQCKGRYKTLHKTLLSRKTWGKKSS